MRALAPGRKQVRPLRAHATMIRVSALPVACALLWVGCVLDGSRTVPEAMSIEAVPVNADFGDYWYRGAAEISSYDLEQLRYGEMRTGKAVHIFVTEPFSQSRHVKPDDESAEPHDHVTVLKLNRILQFTTGIYPYSLMSSVFTPVSGNHDPHSLKVTATAQEWCGHTFAQYDLEADGYKIRHHSYFESNADTTVRLPRAILEDELWTKLRLDPSSLPVGEIQVITGALHQRLSHAPYEVASAQSQFLATEESPSGEQAYEVAFESGGRVLTIRYEVAFPHRVTGWTEDVVAATGERHLVSQAVLDQTLTIDYWNHNRLTDESFRAKLNLD